MPLGLQYYSAICIIVLSVGYTLLSQIRQLLGGFAPGTHWGDLRSKTLTFCSTAKIPIAAPQSGAKPRAAKPRT